MAIYNAAHMEDLRNIQNCSKKQTNEETTWENNIKMYLKVTGSQGVDWIKLAQDRVAWQALVNTIMNFWFP
jgi:hypothetical protein